MTLFYDPKSRKPKIWIILALVIVPFIIMGLTWFYGQKRVDATKSKKQISKEEDIFKKF